jgi:hypothetical protein
MEQPPRARLRQALGQLDDEAARTFGLGLVTLADGGLAASALRRLERVVGKDDGRTEAAVAEAVAAEVGALASEALSLADLWRTAQRIVTGEQVPLVDEEAGITYERARAEEAEDAYEQARAELLRLLGPQPAPAPPEAATLRRTDQPGARPAAVTELPHFWPPAVDATTAEIVVPPVWERAGEPDGTGHRHVGGRIERHHEGDRPHVHEEGGGGFPVVVWLDPDTLAPLDHQPVARGAR